MVDATLSPKAPPTKATGDLLYQMVWKWHFLASLYVLPFLVMLSVTGGIYLYKPQIEAWLYADALRVTPSGEMQAYEAQVAAVEEAVGIGGCAASPTTTIPAAQPRLSSIAGTARALPLGKSLHSGEVLQVVARDRMPMRVLRKVPRRIAARRPGAGCWWRRTGALSCLRPAFFSGGRAGGL